MRPLAQPARLAGSLNLWLATSAARLGGDKDPSDLLNRDELATPVPEISFSYFYALGIAWALLVPLSGLLSLGLVGLAAAIGLHAHSILTRVLYFATAFCMVGVLDAAWRAWVSQYARRRHRQNGRIVDDTTRRLLRIAWINDWTLLLQLAGGVASAVYLR